MTVLVKELRDALIEAGASQEKADAAATVLVQREEVATKTDLAELRAEMHNLAHTLGWRSSSCEARCALRWPGWRAASSSGWRACWSLRQRSSWR